MEIYQNYREVIFCGIATILVQGWGLLKFCSLIFPSRKFYILQKYILGSLIYLAVVTPVKYERDPH